jgi:choline dehydrogenase-like flavoprotein
VADWAALARGVDLSARARYGQRFVELPLGRRLEALTAWRDAPGARHLVRGLLAPLKLVHFDSERAYQDLQCRHAVETPDSEEPARWRSQVMDAGACEDAALDLECDVVVVGTGAGGAPLARELARGGLAVVMLEEGRFFGRRDFNGRPLPMLEAMYRNAGMTLALGGTAIPVPVGKTVGGTTTINAGTALRAPRAVLDGWRDLHGVDVHADVLAPYYQAVELELGVGPSSAAALGQPAVVVARGADALGWSHHALPRNAPGCDGQGLCVFGCPTEAKRSTNVSFVPSALAAGAQLVTGVKVEELMVESDAAKGVVGHAVRADGRSVSVRVRAKAVVLSCGALHTPALLLKQGLANSSGELGRNLSIHPASNAFGLFDERIDGHRAVPQGYAVDEFAGEGIMFEGATAPPELMAASLQTFGPGFVSVMERYRHVLGFGFMIKDSTRGRVRAGPGGAPLVHYTMNAADTAQLSRAMALLCRLMFAAGAREVFPVAMGFEHLTSVAQVDALARARLPARAFDLSAYHPLGTARMGKDPAHSVVSSTHETHDVLNLFVVDGSSIPSSLGVNPQLTIMALSLRAAVHVARRVDRLNARARAASPEVSVSPPT